MDFFSSSTAADYCKGNSTSITASILVERSNKPCEHRLMLTLLPLHQRVLLQAGSIRVSDHPFRLTAMCCASTLMANTVCWLFTTRYVWVGYAQKVATLFHATRSHRHTKVTGTNSSLSIQHGRYESAEGNAYLFRTLKLVREKKRKRTREQNIREGRREGEVFVSVVPNRWPRNKLGGIRNAASGADACVGWAGGDTGAADYLRTG